MKVEVSGKASESVYKRLPQIKQHKYKEPKHKGKHNKILWLHGVKYKKTDATEESKLCC